MAQAKAPGKNMASAIHILKLPIYLAVISDARLGGPAQYGVQKLEALRAKGVSVAEGEDPMHDRSPSGTRGG
jgi:hypothetical protein